jgi:hypothetical protein
MLGIRGVLQVFIGANDLLLDTINSFGQMIHECAKRFNKAEQDLYSHTSPDSLADVQAFVQGIKHTRGSFDQSC